MPVITERNPISIEQELDEIMENGGQEVEMEMEVEVVVNRDGDQVGQGQGQGQREQEQEPPQNPRPRTRRLAFVVPVEVKNNDGQVFKTCGHVEFQIWPSFKYVEDVVDLIRINRGIVKEYGGEETEYGITLINILALMWDHKTIGRNLPNDGFDLGFIQDFVKDPSTNLMRYAVTPSSYNLKDVDVNQILYRRVGWKDLKKLDKMPVPFSVKEVLSNYEAWTRHGYDSSESDSDFEMMDEGDQNGIQEEHENQEESQVRSIPKNRRRKLLTTEEQYAVIMGEDGSEPEDDEQFQFHQRHESEKEEDGRLDKDGEEQQLPGHSGSENQTEHEHCEAPMDPDGGGEAQGANKQRLNVSGRDSDINLLSIDDDSSPERRRRNGSHNRCPSPRRIEFEVESFVPPSKRRRRRVLSSDSDSSVSPPPDNSSQKTNKTSASTTFQRNIARPTATSRNRPVNQKQVSSRRPGGGSIFTTTEDQRIAQLIMKNGWGRYVKGKSLWEFIEQQQLLRQYCGDRTWQALKERFIKTIMPVFDEASPGGHGALPYGVSVEELRRYHQGRREAARNPHTNTFPKPRKSDVII